MPWSRPTGDSRYARAVYEELASFARNCPHPVTGLFPWGEHAVWCLMTHRPCSLGWRPDEPENITHDHLRKAPAWLWQRLWREKREAVMNFVRGLDGHIVNRETFEHCRHATMQVAHVAKTPKDRARQRFRPSPEICEILGLSWGVYRCIWSREEPDGCAIGTEREGVRLRDCLALDVRCSASSNGARARYRPR